MNINPTFTGYEHILIFIALQGAKEGIIKSEYSGSVRPADYIADAPFIKKCIAAWADYLVENFQEYPESTTVPETATVEDVDAIFGDMLAKGYLSYDTRHNIYEFFSLNRVFGYAITSEANIADWGILAWGVDGLGATYASSDLGGELFDEGVTMDEYLAQFPQHNVTGSDIILTLSGSNALSRLIAGWNPYLKGLIAGFRTHLPLPDPAPQQSN